jgi:hypothetical protein
MSTNFKFSIRATHPLGERYPCLEANAWHGRSGYDGRTNKRACQRGEAGALEGNRVIVTDNSATKFSAGAAFRVFGIGLDLDAVTRELGFDPDHQHKRGNLDPGKKPFPHDMWSLKSPLDQTQELELHLTWLAERLLVHSSYIVPLKKRFNVDIYCWKNCFTEQANLTLSSKALRIFTELDLNLQVGLLCLPPEPDVETR